MSKEEKNKFYQAGKQIQAKNLFLNPFKTILNGFHIHMDFTEEEKLLALAIFDNFLIFLLKIGLRPSSTRIYDPYENGPHIQSGWEVKFEAANKEILKQIGVAIGWLMCSGKAEPFYIYSSCYLDRGRSPIKGKSPCIVYWRVYLCLI